MTRREAPQFSKVHRFSCLWVKFPAPVEGTVPPTQDEYTQWGAALLLTSAQPVTAE